MLLQRRPRRPNERRKLTLRVECKTGAPSVPGGAGKDSRGAVLPLTSSRLRLRRRRITQELTADESNQLSSSSRSSALRNRFA
jgi:hypothetical protein